MPKPEEKINEQYEQQVKKIIEHAKEKNLQQINALLHNPHYISVALIHETVTKLVVANKIDTLIFLLDRIFKGRIPLITKKHYKPILYHAGINAAFAGHESLTIKLIELGCPEYMIISGFQERFKYSTLSKDHFYNVELNNLKKTRVNAIFPNEISQIIFNFTGKDIYILTLVKMVFLFQNKLIKFTDFKNNKQAISPTEAADIIDENDKFTEFEDMSKEISTAVEKIEKTTVLWGKKKSIKNKMLNKFGQSPKQLQSAVIDIKEVMRHGI